MAKKIDNFLNKKTTTFYLAMNLFPKEIRDDVKKLYYFLRSVDDIVDEEKNIRKFNDVYQSFKSKKKSKYDFVDIALFLKKRYQIEEKYFIDFFAAQKNDLRERKINIKDKKELLKYCYGVAGVVGIFLLKIFRVPLNKRLIDSAVHFGNFMQLVNILRDVREDYLKSRVYLPQTILKKNQFSFTKFDPDSYLKVIYEFSRIIDEEKNLVDFRLLPKKTRLPIMIASDIYTYIWKSILKNPLKFYLQKFKINKAIVIIIALKKILCNYFH